MSDLTPKVKENEILACPYCKETGYDLMGLKTHLVVGGMFHEPCEAFTNLTWENQEDLQIILDGSKP